MNKRRTFTAVSVASLIMAQSLMAGCSKTEKKSAPEINFDESSWYSVEKCDVLNDYDDVDGVDYVISNYLGVSNGRYVFCEDASYTVPEEDLWTASPADYQETTLLFYDRDLNETDRLDLMKLFIDNGLVSESDFWFSASPVYAGDDKILFTTCGSDSSKIVTIDPDSLEITDISDYDSDSFYMQYDSMERIVYYGNGRVLGVAPLVMGDLCSLVIGLYDSEGAVTFTELPDILPMVGAYDIYDPIMTDDDHAIAKLKTYDGSTDQWIEIDCENCTISLWDEDTSYLDDIDLSNVCYMEDYGSLVIDNSGIKRINVEDGKVEVIFSFDCCNINMNTISDLQIVGYDEDQIIFLSTHGTLHTDGKMTYDNDVIRLTKCETNPNVNKTILTVAFLGDMDDRLAQAICDFNESNPDYRIKIITEYDTASYININSLASALAADDSMEMEMLGYLEDLAEDDGSDFFMTAESDMTDQLTVDLISGAGPDIIINGAAYSQLNSSNCLLDLTDYLESEDIEFIGNMADINRTGDKLYQIPLTFSLSGISADNEFLSNGQVGFTFDQYAQFVDEACNGTDPMEMGKLDFLTAVVMAQFDKYISDGRVNFDNDSFRAAAEYANEHVHDVGGYDPYAMDTGNYYMDLNNLNHALVSGVIGSGHSFVGIPSADGAGPVIKIGDSAAISAHTAHPDACWEFIKMLLSEETQESLGVTSIPVNAQAFEAISEANLDDYSDYYNSFSAEELSWIDFPEPDESFIDDYRDLVCSADRIIMTDSMVMIIMREEIQAYFSGDKSLDDVIDIINNRAQTYYDERG